MALIAWTDDLNTEIPVIDKQHRRIVEYINKLHHAQQQHSREEVSVVLDGPVDYTLSHFAFGESLMEEAGYEFLAIHQKTHGAFRDRVEALKGRFDAKEGIAGPLAALLETWLIRHIMSDDTGYSALVREKMPRIEGKNRGTWLSGALRRFFGH